MGHDKLFHKNKLTRLEKNRKPRKILIVCEGEKTEPNYFMKFEANPEVYDSVDVQGIGHNTVSLIKKAIQIRDEAIQRKKPYIETWCVFDKDDFPVEAFESAIRLAEQNTIKCAYSIEAFEIWYMLHFHFYDSALSRHKKKKKLSELFKKTYIKNNTEMYRLLEKKKDIAIKNARTLFYRQCELPFKDRNPVTTVFQLVERLLG
jgi:hypothetical protein